MVDADGIAELVLRHRDDLRQATRALIEAANDHGGDDNVTAVLFEVAEAGDSDAVAPALVPDPDEADTLHPEDAVALPPLAEDAVTLPPLTDDTVEVAPEPEAPAEDRPLPRTGPRPWTTP